mmetsp:Transcript_17811/g.38589  ORF Transcript_17811/g.38589 Transcript_17811/m.38589 type:complete len:202 (+) Transcript_17811:50-655(+)
MAAFVGSTCLGSSSKVNLRGKASANQRENVVYLAGRGRIRSVVAMCTEEAVTKKKDEREMDFGEGVAEETSSAPKSDIELEKLAKQKEIERLRAAEKFIEIDEGVHECRVCGYSYDPKKGDRLAGIRIGTPFEAIPETFSCPGCKSDKSEFVSVKKVIAGFAENQSYGFGTNTWTEGQKSGLIFGALAVFFVLFLSGYLLD